MYAKPLIGELLLLIPSRTDGFYRRYFLRKLALYAVDGDHLL